MTKACLFKHCRVYRGLSGSWVGLCFWIEPLGSGDMAALEGLAPIKDVCLSAQTAVDQEAFGSLHQEAFGSLHQEAFGSLDMKESSVPDW